jgi:hypothetical protein
MIFRRFLVLQALLLWQGGFLFYASFVVPIGTEILGSAAEQGKITRLVTNALNVVGAVALLILLWDWLQTRTIGPHPRFRFVLWFIMLLMLFGMLWLHPRMDAMIDAAEAANEPLDRRAFRPLHRIYLWMITIQWFAATVYSVSMLRTWSRRNDES